MDQIAPNRDLSDRAVMERSSTEKIAALTVELASRAVAAESLDEVHFLLTNDLRTLVGYDRCFLITHLGGNSDLTAANSSNRPGQEIRASESSCGYRNLAPRGGQTYHPSQGCNRGIHIG